MAFEVHKNHHEHSLGELTIEETEMVSGGSEMEIFLAVLSTITVIGAILSIIFAIIDLKIYSKKSK